MGRSNKKIGSLEPEKKSGEILATVYGFKIKSDTAYVLSDRPDSSAPEGLQEFSKTPFPDNAEVVSIKFDGDRNVWDTGFYAQSPCYYGVSRADAIAESELRTKNIADPYIEYRNVDLDQTNNDFWDNEVIRLHAGKKFHTSDLTQLFQLYCALQSKALTPVHLVGDPTFIRSKYIIEPIESSIDLRVKASSAKFDAMYKFGTMLENEERDVLMSVLVWIKATTPNAGKDDDSLKSIFQSYLDAKNTNAQRFIEETEVIKNDPSHLKMINVNRMLVELSMRGRVNSSTRGITYRENVLGPTINEAARTLCENKLFADTYIAMLSDYESLKN